jgi:hypothetical protein
MGIPSDYGGVPFFLKSFVSDIWAGNNPGGQDGKSKYAALGD